jgi:hypothetical protein
VINRPALIKLHDKQREIAAAFKSNRRVVLRCGRRFGKTSLLERCAAKWAMQQKRVGWFGPQYRLNTPTYSRILNIGGSHVTRKSKIDQIIEFGGGCVEFWTLNDENAGRSRFYDKVIIDEGSLVAKGLRDIWEQAIAPTLLDRRGDAIMAGTPKGIDPDNFFYEACTNKDLGWVEFHAPTSANPMLDPEAVARLVDEYPPLVYQQEYLAEFVDWSGAAFFARDSLLDNGKPYAWPDRCDTVFAVIDTAIKTGTKNDGTGVVFFSYNRLRKPRLLVLDWEYRQIEGALLVDWLPSVFTRLADYSEKCGARYGSSGARIEDKASGMVLLQQAARNGWPARPIDSKLTSVGKDERAVSVSGYVFAKDVGLTDVAYDRVVNFKGITQNHFLTQVCGFRPGVKDSTAHDDLLDCFTYGVSLTCGNSDGY